jgi:hypothetical protein
MVLIKIQILWAKMDSDLNTVRVIEQFQGGKYDLIAVADFARFKSADEGIEFEAWNLFEAWEVVTLIQEHIAGHRLHSLVTVNGQALLAFAAKMQERAATYKEAIEAAVRELLDTREFVAHEALSQIRRDLAQTVGMSPNPTRKQKSFIGWRTARKVHTCAGCNELIRPGTKYRRRYDAEDESTVPDGAYHNEQCEALAAARPR